MSEPRIIVALDFETEAQTLALVDKISPQQARVKVGKELFTRLGPGIVKQLVARGFDVFLDLKFHDIPNTVAKACAASADLGVWMLNVHAQGGVKMLEAARAAVSDNGPLLIAVTVLTSLSAADLAQVGIVQSPLEHALKLADLAHHSGLDGVVCSALEASRMRGQFGDDFILVTPGIRPQTTNDDQQRTLTPAAALGAGSNYLVIGRPITQAADPLLALQKIEQSFQ